MQRSIRHGRSGKAHGIDHSLGRQNARTSDLNDNVPDNAFLFLRRVLVSDRPAREFGRAAERSALREAVDLDDGSVNIERELLPIVPDGVDALTASGDGITRGIRHCREAERFEVIQRLAVGGKRFPARKLQIKDDDLQLPLRGDLRILLPDRARGGVSGICQKLLAVDFPDLVEFPEDAAGHIDLAANDQALRRVL